MTLPTKTFSQIRQALLSRQEIALIDVREEDVFAQAHPLFATNISSGCIAVDVLQRIPRQDTTIVLYDDGEGRVEKAACVLLQLGYSQVSLLEGGLAGWRAAGGELFKDVNVPSKAFGELVAAQRCTPSLSAQDVKALLDCRANVVVLDVRRFDEYHTMSIPSGISVPGAELVLRAAALAPNPATRIIVNCAGRTRSIIGAQSLLNAGIANPVSALRNGTIGWTLAGFTLEQGACRRGTDVAEMQQTLSAQRARAVAERAGVKGVIPNGLLRFLAETGRTTYRFDVRTPEEYSAGHLPGFACVPGGQLVQETDVSMPVRGARVVLADLDGVRANMTGSWLAQMGWEVWVLEGAIRLDFSEVGTIPAPSPPSVHRYRRPYEGTDNPSEAMQAYLDWEYGLVAQLQRDGTHGFKVI